MHLDFGHKLIQPTNTVDLMYKPGSRPAGAEIYWVELVVLAKCINPHTEPKTTTIIMM